MSPRDVVLMVLMVIASWASLVPAADFSKRYVHAGSEGRLVYEIGPRGDRMPDYSHAGYRGGGVEPPLVPAKVIVGPVEGDDTAAIQRALDHVATLPADEAGFRGAVLLEAGVYEIGGQIHLAASGIVLRGRGADREGGSVLVATGRDRRSLIAVRGGSEPTLAEAVGRVGIVDRYVPCGGSRLMLEPGHGLVPCGSSIRARRPGSRRSAWIGFHRGGAARGSTGSLARSTSPGSE